MHCVRGGRSEHFPASPRQASNTYALVAILPSQYSVVGRLQLVLEIDQQNPTRAKYSGSRPPSRSEARAPLASAFQTNSSVALLAILAFRRFALGHGQLAGQLALAMHAQIHTILRTCRVKAGDRLRGRKPEPIPHPLSQ